MGLKFTYKSHEIPRKRHSTRYTWQGWYDSAVPIFRSSDLWKVEVEIKEPRAIVFDNCQFEWNTETPYVQ